MNLKFILVGLVLLATITDGQLNDKKIKKERIRKAMTTPMRACLTFLSFEGETRTKQHLSTTITKHGNDGILQCDVKNLADEIMDLVDQLEKSRRDNRELVTER